MAAHILQIVPVASCTFCMETSSFKRIQDNIFGSNERNILFEWEEKWGNGRKIELLSHTHTPARAFSTFSGWIFFRSMRIPNKVLKSYFCVLLLSSLCRMSELKIHKPGAASQPLKIWHRCNAHSNHFVAFRIEAFFIGFDLTLKCAHYLLLLLSSCACVCVLVLMLMLYIP